MRARATVGEIRDAETAQIATRAALTGHLVLSSIHTNDAPSALTRLSDMSGEDAIRRTADAAVTQICPHVSSTDRALVEQAWK